MNRSKMSAWLAVSCAAAVVSGSALAEPLAPGSAVELGGTTANATPWLAGPNQGGTVSKFFEVQDTSGNPIFQGTINASATSSTELGTLRFSYRIVNTQALGERRVRRVDFAGYGGFQTNVDYRTDGLGSIGPDEAARTASGAQVAFFFNEPILPAGADSRFFYIHTEATAYNSNVQALITLNTGESVIVNGLRGPAFTDCPGDTNGDGVINFTDLNTVLSNFGEECD